MIADVSTVFHLIWDSTVTIYRFGFATGCVFVAGAICFGGLQALFKEPTLAAKSIGLVVAAFGGALLAGIGYFVGLFD